MINVEIHVVGVKITRAYVDDGTIKPLPDNATIKQTMTNSMHPFVIPNQTATAFNNGQDFCRSPHDNSDYTVEQYLSLEASDGFILVHMDQYTIVTQSYNFGEGSEA